MPQFCEVNYAWSFVAERYNTFSNVVMLGLALYSIRQCVGQRLPTRAIVGHLGLAGIGLGSTLFHATLRAAPQMLDESSMLLSSSIWLFCFLDAPTRGATLWTPRSRVVAFGLTCWFGGLVAAYGKYQHFEIFQIAFAFTQLSVSAGIIILARRFGTDAAGRARRAEYVRIQILGHASFVRRHVGCH